MLCLLRVTIMVSLTMRINTVLFPETSVPGRIALVKTNPFAALFVALSHAVSRLYAQHELSSM